jgi:hypothetical protein
MIRLSFFYCRLLVGEFFPLIMGFVGFCHMDIRFFSTVDLILIHIWIEMSCISSTVEFDIVINQPIIRSNLTNYSAN